MKSRKIYLKFVKVLENYLDKRNSKKYVRITNRTKK